MKISDVENKKEMENRKTLIEDFLADWKTYLGRIGQLKPRAQELREILRVFLNYADEKGQRLRPMYDYFEAPRLTARGASLQLGSGQEAVIIHVEPQRRIKVDLVLVRDMIEAIEYSDGILTIPAKNFEEGAGR